MVRALGKGYMPSTDQLIVNLRTLIASNALNPDVPGLNKSSRLLLKYSKQWLFDFIEMLRNKSDQDQIQDFIWAASRAKISLDTDDVIQQATSTNFRVDASAAYESIRTIGSLLLTNSDFRMFLQDLNVLGRQVLADTANELSEAAEITATQIEPPDSQSQALKAPGNEEWPVPTTGELLEEATEITDSVVDGVKSTGQAAGDSLKDKLGGEEKDSLLFRLKSAVTKLRKRTDYSESVSIIGLLIKRYAKIYSRAADETIGTLQGDIETNEELDRAVKLGWQLLSSFGKKEAWDELERRFKKVVEHAQTDAEFESLMGDIASSTQDIFMDPGFFESSVDKSRDAKWNRTKSATLSPLRQDLDQLLEQARLTCETIANDDDVSKILRDSLRIWAIISPIQGGTNDELLVDTYNFFVPLLIQAVQYIPIPRLEVSAPEIDLLLENLILEPGRTINHTSFLPFKLNINTNNDLTIRKARYGTTSSLTTLVTVNLQGLSIRADEVGFWMRAHKGLLRLADEGIASLELDDRGIDVAIDFEIGKDHIEKILSLRNVKVKIHHLNYTLRRSKFACLAWLFKPIVRPIIRKVLESKLSSAIEDGIHAANRELVYARERLRATRISDPKDLQTFVRAIITRLIPEEDPDLYTNVGVVGGANEQGNVFAGVYAPGSIVKLWQEEAQEADERVEDSEVKGWRNEIFDVQAGPLP
ncbi:hypothetical protein V496_04480 [Pseudogymnoascus sp. VKM F-4515 (FW-2607)]|nr:hypothetical protein V496_04480 [Pseudogymnoascus sp. VKM F-4515 (FW-2607)]KFY90058.1 hypothetical protein V498_06189 [Pseudogymnoascus sp. VKM F-4517 (FW-2822)]